MKKAVVLFVGVLAFGATANASLIPILSSITASGNVTDPYQWNYQVILGGDERMDPTATSSANPAGTFFTLYDVTTTFPLVIGTPSGWVWFTQAIGTTPNGESPADSGLFNITFLYTGPVINGPVTIAGFDIDFATNVQVVGAYTYQATLNNNTITNGLTDHGGGPVAIPDTSVVVPEPASGLPLVGTGMAGLALLRRKLTRKNR